VIFLSVKLSYPKIEGLQLEQEPEDSIFSFGQILSIMLLAGPLLVIISEILSAICGDHTATNLQSTSSPTPIASVTNSPNSQQPADQDEAVKQEIRTEEIHASFQDAITATDTTADWPICGHRHHLGRKWAVALLLMQLWYTFETTGTAYVAGKSPVTTLVQYPAWFFVTLPSAIYSITTLGLDARGSKRVMIPALFLLFIYSGIFWPFVINEIMYVSTGEPLVAMVRNVWKDGLSQFLGMMSIIGVYISCVCMMALVLRFSRWHKQRGISPNVVLAQYR
jgi:hypothetical protein